MLIFMQNIGLITAMAYMAYIGTEDRFSSGKLAACYSGLISRVDRSGTIDKHKSIVKRGYGPQRRCIIQEEQSLCR